MKRVKASKARILRIVTHVMQPTNDKYDPTVNRRHDETEFLQARKDELNVLNSYHTHVSTEDPPNAMSECHSEITSQEFNELFPGDIEALYDQTSFVEESQKQRRTDRMQHSNFIATNGTSFLNLPRELRNQIYEYVLSTDKVWRVRAKVEQDRDGRGGTRIREQLPKLYYAIPLFSQEVLETHYRCSTLQFAAIEDERLDLLLDWIEHRGLAFTKCIRHMKITHRMNMKDPYMRWHFHGYITTHIERMSDGGLCVWSKQRRSPGACQCGIMELVQERLSREEALADTDCVQWIEKSTEYGPILGFALQLLQAVRLSQKHEKILMDLPWPQRADVHQRIPQHCIICGRRKWGLQY